MEFLSLFSHLISYEYLKIDNRAIEQYCYNLERSSAAVDRQLGFQCSVDLNESVLSPIVSAINANLRTCEELLSIKKEYPLKLANGWININKPQGKTLQNNIMHFHPGRYMSFVYYVKGPPMSGDLTLYSPIHDMIEYAIPTPIYEKNTVANSSQWVVTPESGKLIMFPGWIRHRAEQNIGYKDRISIAFNAIIDNIEFKD